jgi:DNA-binding YbaB/EbfC family protein
MADDDEQPAFDMGSLLGMAAQVQQQLAAAHEEAAHTVVEGQSGGGVVRIAVTGGLEFRSVTISPDAVDPDDAELLGDLVLAALHDAMARVQELGASANPLGGLMGGLMGDADLGGLGGGLDLGGLMGGLGDLGGMLGLSGAGADEDDEHDEGGSGHAHGSPGVIEGTEAGGAGPGTGSPGTDSPGSGH